MQAEAGHAPLLLSITRVAEMSDLYVIYMCICVGAGVYAIITGIGAQISRHYFGIVPRCPALGYCVSAIAT